MQQLQKGDAEAAVKAFAAAVKLDPQHGQAWYGKARVLVNAQRVDDARPVAQRYLELVDEAERQQPAIRALMDICGIDV